STPCLFFLPNQPPSTSLYPLSLHDALPIWPLHRDDQCEFADQRAGAGDDLGAAFLDAEGAALHDIAGVRSVACLEQHLACVEVRSEEHTSELQSRENLVCRLLLEKKKRCEP